MWTYSQRSGELSSEAGLVAVGYAGCGAGRNNPEMQSLREVGPLPRGTYLMGPAFDSETHGPVCMRLRPLGGTETFGRDGFMVHGDSRFHPGMASQGCIILPRVARMTLANSEDRVLEVVL